MTIEVFTIFSQSLSHILGNNDIPSFCLSKGLKIKTLFIREFHIWIFWGPKLGPGWVKNDEKAFFMPATSTPNPVFPKKEVLKSLSLLTNTLSKLKDKPNGLHKTLLAKVYFLLKLIVS